MKTIRTFITEKLKVSSNVKHGDCTLEEFLVWYCFDNKKTIEALTFQEFFLWNFSPKTSDEYFGGSIKKVYNFLLDHLDYEIELYDVEENGYSYYRFFIDNISFTVDRNGREFEKKK